MGQYMCRLNVSMRSQVNGVYFFLKHVNCGMYKIWQRDLHVVTFAYTLLYSWPLLCSFTYLFLTSLFCEYRIKGVSFMCQNFYTDDKNEWVNIKHDVWHVQKMIVVKWRHPTWRHFTFSVKSTWFILYICVT